MLAHLIHRCVVKRASLANDAYGNKSRTYSTHLSNQACRYKERSQRGFNSITAEFVTITTYQLFVPFETDIVAGDRISQVTLEDGTVLSETYEVEAALSRRGASIRHKTLELERVK